MNVVTVWQWVQCRQPARNAAHSEEKQKQAIPILSFDSCYSRVGGRPQIKLLNFMQSNVQGPFPTVVSSFVAFPPSLLFVWLVDIEKELPKSLLDAMSALIMVASRVYLCAISPTLIGEMLPKQHFRNSPMLTFQTSVIQGRAKTGA